MALWQFNVELIPKAWFERSGNDLNDLILDDGYETSSAWRDHQPNVDIDTLMANIFVPTDSWHSEIRIWSNEKESDIQVG
jgi:hypothetical protein